MVRTFPYLLLPSLWYLFRIFKRESRPAAP